MAKETLTVKNFGPIREAELDLRKVTVLIGPQASGKSVLAKLLHITSGLSPTITQELSNEQFSDYKIDNFKNEKSEIFYKNALFECKFSDDKFTRKNKSQELIILFEEIKEAYNNYSSIQNNNKIIKKHKNKAGHGALIAEMKVARINYHAQINKFYEHILANLYYPAERTLIPMLSDSLFSLMNSEINIPKFVLDFGSEFESIRLLYNHVTIPILDAKYFFEGKDFVETKDGIRLTLKESSSGFQSLIPMLLMIDNYNSKYKRRSIIEEPELNLYPTTQKKLVEYLIEKCTKGDNRLIITTHSPYILTALNNCLEASNVLKANPDAKAQVDTLVPPASQIAYEDVAAYYVADGTARSIMNEEYQMIDANALDDVSDELGRIHGELLDLKYQLQD